MDETFLTRREHSEYAKRMEDEHTRQNHRLAKLEEAVEHNNTLTIAVEKMAVNMEQMLKEQLHQGKRLDELEKRDGDMWRKAVGYAVTVLIGLVLGYIAKNVGL